MEERNMTFKQPEIVVYAGPNGSGKSTFVQIGKVVKPFINADEIKKNIGCTDLEAAQKASKLREELISRKESFTFETVLSTKRNLDLLRKAKDEGYFIRCIYVLTRDSSINIARVAMRTKSGGHDVPQDKIVSRYRKSLENIPELLSICDICHIYDNYKESPFRFFKKRKNEFYIWENEYWDVNKIMKLIGHEG